MKRSLLALMLLLGGAPTGQAEDFPNLLPNGWRPSPTESGQRARRYYSPDGAAWISFYGDPADQSRQRHMDRVARGGGERITYERRTAGFIAVSGYKGSRIFYRKSNLACHGTRWHTIAMEYPIEAKRAMDSMVLRIAHAMNRYDRDCRTAPRSG